MAGERYVALGLATARSAWFNDVARWATVGSVPVEFVKCISAEEMRARLASGRAFSVALVDAGTNAIDRDLLDLATSLKVAVIAVDDGRTGRDWPSLGVRAVLPPTFDRQALLDTLAHVGTMIGGATALPVADAEPTYPSDDNGHLLVAVTGSGGTGTSTIAIALAQGLGESSRAGEYQPRVALADLRLDAEQAMLHDARDIIPGVQELVEAHRSGQPTADEIESLTFDVPNRGYRLLLGLRRHRDWTALRPRSFEAALAGLQRTFATVVADVDAETEGEAQTGSVEVEERNLMARSVCTRADLVVVVGRPGVKGVHGLVRVINSLREFGVDPTNLLAIINGAPRSPRIRAEHTRSFADLTGATAGLTPVVGPVFIAERRGLDELHRDGARMPAALTRSVVGSVRSALEHAAPQELTDSLATAITPGSLGLWPEQEAAGQ